MERAADHSFPGIYMDAIEQQMRSVINSSPLSEATLFNTDLVNILEYHLGWTDTYGRASPVRSGKRLRPLICLLSREAASETANSTADQWRDTLPAAAAIELLHNFTLIHDDIQDNSEERHGRLAVWKIWGMAQGINAGDALFVFAHLALDGLSPLAPPSTLADVHRFFDSASLAITRGQFLDISFETRGDVTVDDYIEMIAGKTAALISSSAKIGARIGTDDTHLVDSFAKFGGNLGLAFQIADDILGIWGDPAVTGKPANGDILAKKKTLPLLLALQQDQMGEIREFLRQEEVDEADVARIKAGLDRMNVRAAAEALAEGYANNAVSALENTGLSNFAIERLQTLAHGAVRRDK